MPEKMSEIIERIEKETKSLTNLFLVALGEVRAEREQAREDLEEERRLLSEERSRWEEEKSRIKRIYAFGRPLVKLNVGGTLMTTRISTLRSAGGFLDSLFSGRFEPDRDEEGNIFLDYSAKDFSLWLNLLRFTAQGKRVLIPKSLLYMLDFFQPEVEEEWAKDTHPGRRRIKCRYLVPK